MLDRNVKATFYIVSLHLRVICKTNQQNDYNTASINARSQSSKKLVVPLSFFGNSSR